MKTKLQSGFSLQPLAFAVLAALTLFTATPRARAQSEWGDALSFDGVADYVYVNPGVVLSNSSFSIEFWAQRAPTPPSNLQVLFNQGTQATNQFLKIQFNGANITFGFWADDLSGSATVDSSWHHWAFTYDATTRARNIFMDGEVIAQDTASANYQGSGPLFLSGLLGTSQYCYAGILDDVRIWNVARSQADIVAQMSYPLTGRESNLLAYWKFDEGSGTTAHDATGHGYDGTLDNGPQWTPSTIPLWGNALSLNGTNQYVAVPTNTWFGSQFTIETWVYERSYNSSSRVIDFGNGAPSDNVIFFLSTGTSGEPFLTVYRGETQQYIQSPQPIPTNQWVHLAVTLANNTGTIYVNGVAVVSGTVTAPNAVNRTNNYIGRSNWSADSYANAIFDELRIWNVARTAAQIQDGMCHPLSGTESNLVAYWKFDEVAGNTAYDATANHFDATLVNGPVWTNSTIPPFVSLNTGLPGVSAVNWHASAAWGDYDNDGRLDILLTGDTTYVVLNSEVWHNNGDGTFSNINAGPPGGVAYGSVAWGDYDNDGRLDILLTGETTNGALISQVWHNNGDGTFSDINAGLPGVIFSSVAWGDYDNDGRMDILLTGTTNYGQNGAITQVWHNNGDGTFSNINAGLPGVASGSVAWGDYDNDGRLDILLTGETANGALISQVWHNNGDGTFSDINAGLPGVAYGSVAWGDYDNDGRLDILLTGATNVSSVSSGIAQVWHNNGDGTFSNINAGLPGVYFSSVAWGDYDNDGRLDILLTGTTNVESGSSAIAQVWHNNGDGTFSNINAGLPGVYYSSVAWGDYDNDGRLDFLVTGESANGPISQVWRNIGWATNTLPAPPTGLAVAVTGSALSFSWNAASDAETPAAGLSYNVRVGTTPGGSDIISPQADPTGARRLPALGNAQEALRVPLTSPRTGRIYWSVQAVDTAFAGSPFAPESSFNLWPVLGPATGPVPGDTNGDGIVDAGEFANVLPYLNGNGSVDPGEFAAVLARLNGNGSVSQAELNMVLSNYYPYAALCLTNTWGLGGKSVSFALSNSAAGAFSVLVSSNLVNWDYLGPATPRYGFTDTNAPAALKRFYRLSWP